MAKSVNPMEVFRREQKKKELKKLRTDRQKDKQAKLSSMDPTELKEQLKALERQVAGNPSDGPTHKRKQELEDTLQQVVKKQKEMQEEERKKQKEAPPPPPMTATELKQANREKFQNPENSVYYHPTLNPFGAPPPGMPQRYRGMPPSAPGTALRGPPPRGPRQGYQGQQSHRGPPPRVEGREPPPQQPRIMARRPGKRPPLPSGPPPPGTIQVPPRPPLPSGAIPLRPPPPPPMHAQASRMPPPPPQQPREMVPPPPPIAADTEMEARQHAEDDSVVAPYPTIQEEDHEMDDKAAERAAESHAQLRSLVPVALRVQRRAPAAPSSSSASVISAPPVPAPRPSPAPAPRLAPPPPTKTSSVSKEFDAFMDEVQDLL